MKIFVLFFVFICLFFYAFIRLFVCFRWCLKGVASSELFMSMITRDPRLLLKVEGNLKFMDRCLYNKQKKIVSQSVKI